MAQSIFQINGQSLPANASLWKIDYGVCNTSIKTIMDGRMPALSGDGYGVRTLTVSIMVKDTNDRDNIELVISRILAMFSDMVTLKLYKDTDNKTVWFYGALKQYSIKALIKKRAQILILSLQGILYKKDFSAAYYTYTGGQSYVEYIPCSPSSLYRPCLLWVGSIAGRTTDIIPVVEDCFADPVTGEGYGFTVTDPDNAVYAATKGVYIDGLTGTTGRATYQEPEMEMPANDSNSSVSENEWISNFTDYAEHELLQIDSVEPISQYAKFEKYPIIRPQTTYIQNVNMNVDIVFIVYNIIV